jgi:O-antigen/teichoic acid export membrane protein
MLAARIVRAPLWLLASALLARLLGPDGLGTWAMVLAAAMLANQVLLLWSQSITQRFGRSEWLESRSLSATWSLRWPLLAAGGFVAALLLLAPLDWHARFYGLSASERWLVVPMLLALWWMGEAQGLQQVRARFASMAWSPVLADAALLAAIAGLLVVGADERLRPGTAGTLVALVLTGVVVWGAFLARELRGLPLRWHLPAPDAWRQALIFAAPLVPGYVIGYLAEWCDYLLIGHFYGTREVGLFHAAYQYMLLLVGVPTAVAAVMLPQVVTAMDRSGEHGLRGLVERTAPQLIALWALATFALLAVLPWLFATLTGERFAEAQVVLQVLLIAVPGAIASHVYGIAHFAQGRLGVANVCFFGVKLTVNVLVSLALLPSLGVVGSAIGSAVSYILLQWLFLLDQHHRLSLSPRLSVRALALAQAGGALLALFSVGPLRLVVAIAVLIIILTWVRRSRLFTRAEVSSLFSPSLARLARAAARLLCSSGA